MVWITRTHDVIGGGLPLPIPDSEQGMLLLQRTQRLSLFINLLLQLSL